MDSLNKKNEINEMIFELADTCREQMKNDEKFIKLVERIIKNPAISNDIRNAALSAACKRLTANNVNMEWFLNRFVTTEAKL